ncbi:hypothetical protein DPMN_025893 [Dreissena polymorpha]|uniref:Ig-like domain-containing protein n=1 Tax=Dreissena polymorpha TaxID=45954 RepID=A0A9D4RCY7_DREPO|nr:hypothetical protein DPMN_025893 [Dreissena polymorpha]
MTLAVLVNSVTINPPLNVLRVLEDLTINYMTYLSSLGRPAPIITWCTDNRTTEDYNDDRNLTIYANSSTTNDVTTSVLTFTPVRNYSNNSIYCNVSNGYGAISSSQRLRLDILTQQTKPVIHLQGQTISKVAIIKLRNMSLECTSTGNPILTIAWRTPLNGVFSGNVLALQNVQIQDNGTYHCSALSVRSPTYGIPEVETKSSSVDVNIMFGQEAPSFTFRTCGMDVKTNQLKVIQGHSVNGTCFAVRNPSPTYTWSPGTFGHGYAFIIDITQRSYSGTYTCTAANVMEPTLGDSYVGRNHTIFTLDILCMLDTTCCMN